MERCRCDSQLCDSQHPDSLKPDVSTPKVDVDRSRPHLNRVHPFDVVQDVMVGSMSLQIGWCDGGRDGPERQVKYTIARRICWLTNGEQDMLLSRLSFPRNADIVASPKQAMVDFSRRQHVGLEHHAKMD